MGDFIRLRQKELDVIYVPELGRTHAPRQLFRFKNEEQPKPPIVKPRISLWQSLFRIEGLNTKRAVIR